MERQVLLPLEPCVLNGSSTHRFVKLFFVPLPVLSFLFLYFINSFYCL